MAGYTTQRIKNFKEGYIEMWQQGYTIIEIAKHYQICRSSAYNNLQEIADKNGYTREELLMEPEHSGVHSTVTAPFRKETVDAEQLRLEFQNAEEAVKKLIENIDSLEETI